MNDLWKFDGAEWTWIGGSDLPNQAGSYGSQGTPSASNIPGGREGAGVWQDDNGIPWLLGGWGLDSSGNTGYMNDLWSYTGALWTWESGSNLVNQPGSYGTQGEANPTNTPGARQGGITWTDTAGELWLHAGAGFDASGNLHYLNDLWKFNGAGWIWIGGSNGVDQPGIYGTQGTADPANIPGGREGAMTWKDLDGDQWLFGGWGIDALGEEGDLNDLWQYLP